MQSENKSHSPDLSNQLIVCFSVFNVGLHAMRGESAPNAPVVTLQVAVIPTCRRPAYIVGQQCLYTGLSMILVPLIVCTVSST